MNRHFAIVLILLAGCSSSTPAPAPIPPATATVKSAFELAEAQYDQFCIVGNPPAACADPTGAYAAAKTAILTDLTNPSISQITLTADLAAYQAAVAAILR
jgi:hypothetical protein